MPIHDWTRVNAGTFHAFHVAWIADMQKALNRGLLPDGYYALAEQVAGGVIPDVLTLQDLSGAGSLNSGNREKGNGHDDGGIAVAEAPPRVALSDTISESVLLAMRRRQIVIRHSTGDRIVALIEIVSPGNKEKQGAMQAFVDKAASALEDGYHLLVIDLLPPGSFDPAGIHGAIWQELGGTYQPPKDKGLTLCSYAAGQKAVGAVTCYVEPTAVGNLLTPMPLFVDPEHYVNVPLEATYNSAYEGVPARWKRVIEGGE